MKNILFYGFQFTHHGGFSAFTALKKTFKSKGIKVVTAIIPSIFYVRGFRRFYQLWMRLQEGRLYNFFKSSDSGGVHYYFPDNSLFCGIKWKKNKKIIITCHQPVDKNYFERIRITNSYIYEGIKKADIIILMASDGIPIYKKVAPQAEVLCIPYGIDTTFFSRNALNISPRNISINKRVLTVGGWLRDYRFWVAVVKKVLVQDETIEFTVIASADTINIIKDEFNNKIPARIK